MGELTNAIPMDASPHTTMISASHLRPPSRFSAMVAGMLKMKLPAKKSPTPNPNLLADKPSAAFIESAAKDKFTRSR
jgi:hypothetical protein